jgi:integrase
VRHHKTRHGRILRDRLTRKDHGELIADAHRLTFGDLATMVLDDYRVKHRRSWRRLEDALARLSAFFGGVPVVDGSGSDARVRRYVGGCRALAITPDRWTAYVAARLAAGAAPATVAVERAALRRAFTLAVRAGRLAQAPHLESLGSLNNARRGFFDAADFEAVVAALPDDLKPVMRFAYWTGWRVQSEVLPLTWRDVDLDAGVVRLEPGTTKNAEGRAFPFDALPALKALLYEQRARTTTLERSTGTIVPWVFHRNGRPIKSYRRKLTREGALPPCRRSRPSAIRSAGAAPHWAARALTQRRSSRNQHA